jgi:hypothetical protein
MELRDATFAVGARRAAPGRADRGGHQKCRPFVLEESELAKPFERCRAIFSREVNQKVK